MVVVYQPNGCIGNGGNGDVVVAAHDGGSDDDGGSDRRSHVLYHLPPPGLALGRLSCARAAVLVTGDYNSDQSTQPPTTTCAF